MQSWLIAAGSDSISEMFSNLRCEGHPPLWYLMLYPLTRITHNPAAMQYLHLSIAVAGVYVFLRFAPFTRLQRLLFVFGYFPLYEYAAISRNYGVGIFLLFCFCVVCGAAVKHLFVLCIILVFLSMASAHAFIIAVCLLAAIVFKVVTDASAKAAFIKRKRIVLLCIIVILLGFAVSAVVMFPEPNCFFASGWTTAFDAEKLVLTVATVWQGLVPIPQFTRNFWNTNIITGQITQVILAAVLMCFFLLSMANNRAVLLFYVLAFGVMLVLQYVVYLGALRHFGYFFMVIIACLWLERVWGEDKPVRGGMLSRISTLCARPRQWLIITLFVIHLAVGIFASVMEWRYPFSQAKNTARYIKENGLDKLPILGHMDYVVSTVAGYLDRPFYYPSDDRFGTFAVYNEKNKRYIMLMDAAAFFDKAWQLAEKNRSDVLLVLHWNRAYLEVPVVPLEEFAGSLCDENFYLFLLKYSE